MRASHPGASQPPPTPPACQTPPSAAHDARLAASPGCAGTRVLAPAASRPAAPPRPQARQRPCRRGLSTAPAARNKHADQSHAQTTRWRVHTPSPPPGTAGYHHATTPQPATPTPPDQPARSRKPRPATIQAAPTPRYPTRSRPPVHHRHALPQPGLFDRAAPHDRQPASGNAIAASDTARSRPRPPGGRRLPRQPRAPRRLLAARLPKHAAGLAESTHRRLASSA